MGRGTCWCAFDREYGQREELPPHRAYAYVSSGPANSMLLDHLVLGRSKFVVCILSMNRSTLVPAGLLPTFMGFCPASDHGNGVRHTHSTYIQPSALIEATHVDSCIAQSLGRERRGTAGVH